jgi:hypothetical protein
MCTGLLWSNIKKLGTGTFAFQIMYHLNSFLGTHFGIYGTCNNLLLMEMINLILKCTKQIINTSVQNCIQVIKLNHVLPKNIIKNKTYSSHGICDVPTCDVAIPNTGRRGLYCCHIFTATRNVEKHKCRVENFKTGSVLANELYIWQCA